MGLWRYDYNVLGELTEQTDAKGQVTCFKYDLLGRMRERSEFMGPAPCPSPPPAHEKSTWAYDFAAHRIGNLASETTSGFTRTYTYDPMSRPESTTTRIDGVSYVSSLSYDLASRVAVITYPGSDGFAVRNLYTPSGYLEKVQRSGGGSVYWTATSADAEGRITHETLGNGLSTRRGYDPASGRLETILTGVAPGAGVQHLSYQYDPLGNLLQRADARQGLSESFLYDDLNRLTRATTVTGGVTLTKVVGYDALGTITNKTGVGAYSYAPGRPHAVTQAGGSTYSYDANGNMVTGANRTITYNAANQVTRIAQGTAQVHFSYAPDRARYNQAQTGPGPTQTTHYIGGLYEQVTRDTTTTRRHYIQANGQTIAIHTTRNNGTPPETRYLHRDHLGSVDAITDDIGRVVERLSYDGWGRRRPANWTDPVGQLTASLSRGFTGHEHLDDVGLIHMNGRVFDPTLGRFASADPFVQFPKASQSLNRYAYVLNNPLSYTDPSGFGIFSELLQFSELNPLNREVHSWFAKSTTLQQIGGVAAGVASVYFGPWVAAAYSAHLTNLNGGSTSDIMKAGAIAGAAAGASGATGGLNPYQAVAANIAIGTAAGVASGADFESSFYASAFTAVASVGLSNIKGNTATARVARIIVAATIGGTASELSGGKFADGALTLGFLAGAVELADFARGETDRLKRTACATTASEACDVDERGVLRTDGRRGVDYSLNPGESGSALEPFEMAREGYGLHSYDPGGPLENKALRWFATDASKIHDWMNSWNYNPSNGLYMSRGVVFDTVFSIYSGAGMPVAALATVAAYVGSAPFQQQMLHYTIYNYRRRDP